MKLDFEDYTIAAIQYTLLAIAYLLAALIVAGCGIEPGSLLVTPSAVPSEPPAAAAPTSPQDGQGDTQITPGVVCIVKTGENGGALHVRSGAGVEYQVIGYSAEGDTLTVLETAGNGWRKVNTPAGVIGWVNSVYCRKD